MNKLKQKQLLIVLFLWGTFVFGAKAQAADVYMSPNGTKTIGKSTPGLWPTNPTDLGGAGNANCYSNLEAAMGAMSSGDTLTINDGTYLGNANLIQNGAAVPPSGPGTGTGDARFTIIKARNIPCQNGYACNSPLKVIIGTPVPAVPGGSGSVQDPAAGIWMGSSMNRNWVKIQGIWFKNSVGLMGVQHWYFKQCAIQGDRDGNNQVFDATDTLYTLYEDVVVNGKGRFGISWYANNQGTPSYSLVRRAVVRQDYVDAGFNDPMAGFAIYHNTTTDILNSIVIDGDPAFWKTSSAVQGAFSEENNETNQHYTIQGSIAINDGKNLAFGQHDGATGILLKDVAAVKIGGGALYGAISGNRVTEVDVHTNNFPTWHTNGNTFVHLGPDLCGGDCGWGYYSSGSPQQSIDDSVVVDAGTAVFQGSAPNYAGNNLNYYNSALGIFGGTKTTSNPIFNDLTNPTGSIKYPVRVEEDSLLRTAGASGGQVGADITQKLGVDGTFYGQTDYNTPQGSLWPWPLEDWVKTQMASMDTTIGGSQMPTPTRGFASPTAKRLDGVNPVTLTSYIWESLGNPIPADLYGTATPIDGACGTASGQSFSSLSSSSLNLCSQGIVASFSGSGPWTWGCNGSNGGTSTSATACSATVIADNVAPVITNGQPTGTLNYGTTSATLSVVTDENATCKYGTTDVAYASLSNPFASTGGTGHSQLLTGLTNGSTYRYYVKCADGNGNANASSTVISFDISAINGNTYYLSPTGSDSANCSQGTPCKTMSKAATLAVAGDTIYLADGTYPAVTLDGSSITNFKGTSTAPIIIKAQGTNAVIAARANDRGNLYLLNTSYIIIDGIKTSGGTGTNAAGIAVRFSDHVTIKNCTSYNNSQWGIFVSNSPNVVLENNEAYGQTSQHGIYAADATTSHDQPIVRGNKLHDNPMNGLHMNGDNGGVGYFTGALIENNIIYNNVGQGINLDGVQATTIRNNLLYNNHGAGISMYKIDAAQGPTGNLVYNNTIDMASDSKWNIRFLNSQGTCTFRNNIFYNRNTAHGAISTNTSTDVTNTDSDYNLLIGTYAATPNDGGSTYTVAQWKALGKDTHSLTPNITTIFQNLASLDYHLAQSSPAKDAGQIVAVTKDIEGTTRPQGTAFDIGAYEKVVSVLNFQITDFITITYNWFKSTTSSDLNSDTIINSQDLGIMMSKWQ